MNAWSNISISPRDPEIIRINDLEAKLGKLPSSVYNIRGLVTRHEVCHFKYRQHIKKIKDSILNLMPCVDSDKIGISHIRHGENAWKKDTSGRSLLGQQYIWSLRKWLNAIPQKATPDKYDEGLGQKIEQWLGDKNADKKRLVQLLLARLTWDWKPYYEELQKGGKYKDLEFQICRTDICHYAFPTNLDRLLQGIGEMRPMEDFEGCGSFDPTIQRFVEKELLALHNLFKALYKDRESDPKKLLKAWLIVCFIKTLKEQAGLSEPLIELEK